MQPPGLAAILTPFLQHQEPPQARGLCSAFCALQAESSKKTLAALRWLMVGLGDP